MKGIYVCDRNLRRKKKGKKLRKDRMLLLKCKHPGPTTIVYLWQLFLMGKRGETTGVLIPVPPGRGLAEVLGKTHSIWHLPKQLTPGWPSSRQAASLVTP